MALRILITTDYLHPGDGVDQLLRDHGLEPVYSPFRGPRPYEERRALFDGISGAILASEPVTAVMLAHAASLKVIARSGVGYDSIDIQAATAQGIRVCNAPGTNHHSVAELTIGLIIMAARRLSEVTTAVRQGGWPRDAGHELRGSTLGIIGYGPSGRATANLGAALGMNVLASTRHPDPDNTAIQFTGLDTVIRNADYLSLHTRAGQHTGPLIDAPRLEAMKPTAVLINTARGSLVDEEALAKAIADGTIAGAALDVLQSEPLPDDSPLRGLDNVLITSHLAGQTAQARTRAGLAAAQAVIDVLENRKPAHPADR
ncbi:phosphoglycerate dehydrogenase-like enzyme [Pseudarthrobacter sp. W1I19]|uniref:phosphoglycerate dehydrogenase n=1 Tax=Pseudarthrobacter sp. W1I19 TaxID=3042288 RepID=UPI0027876FBE|nr:phosphoglycerate dehydrogenase [Pseudarthrobacter sp. W1I19]MDQ0923792.1 phosphoglycerate dehydrogenase-like enzyme [Pseudarthrobacter sp. W1I19]